MFRFIVNVKSSLFLFLVFVSVLPGYASPLILEGAPVGELAGWVSETANRSIVIPDAMNFKVWLRSPSASASSALSLLRSTALVNGWEMTDKAGIISFISRQNVPEPSVSVAPSFLPSSLPVPEIPPVELFNQSFNFLNRPAADLMPVMQSMAGDEQHARFTLGAGNTVMVTAPLIVLERLRGQVPALDTLRTRFRVEAIISEESNGLTQQLGVNLSATTPKGSNLTTDTGASIAGASVIAQFISLRDFTALYTYLVSGLVNM